MDLGISSYQIDKEGRGFSYRYNSKLDMRFDLGYKKTAYDILNMQKTLKQTSVTILSSSHKEKMALLPMMFLLLLLVFSCNINQENFELSGKIHGLENGTIYLIKSNNNDEEIILDSTGIDYSSSFLLKSYIKEPQILTLRLGKSNLNEIEFFAETGKMRLNTSNKRFQFDAKFIGSKQQSNLDEFNSYLIKFEEKDIDLLEHQIQESIEGNKKEIDSISILRENNYKRKILFIINYITNKKEEIISPYLALKYNIDIQADYLSKIYNSYSKEISESKYGIELNKIINK